jgi:broad specificity phosphatase PhoE
MKRLVLSLLIFAAASATSAQPVLVIVRHAEKTIVGGNDPDLSPAGRTRAEELARILKDSGITAIFTSEFKRTQQTAAPIATSLGITPTIISSKDINRLVSKLHELIGNALVVGHGDSIPTLVATLGIKERVQIPEDDYTEMFMVTLGAKAQLFRLHYGPAKPHRSENRQVNGEK